MPKGSDLLVAALENEGVDRIFGVPGEENLDVVESLRTSSIELVITRHEQAAAFMAATHGRLTGKPGVCISTLGPGALNFSTGAAYAHLGAMPMIMITGQKAIMTARQARFQIVDVIASMKPLTKMTPPDRQRRLDPGHRARGVPGRHGGAPRSGASRAAGGRGGRGGRAGADRAPAPGRHPGRAPGGARPGRRDDPARPRTRSSCSAPPQAARA